MANQQSVLGETKDYSLTLTSSLSLYLSLTLSLSTHTPARTPDIVGLAIVGLATDDMGETGLTGSPWDRISACTSS